MHSISPIALVPPIPGADQEGTPSDGMETPLQMVVDGCNVLFRLRDRFGIHFEHGLPQATARNQLVHLLTLCLKTRPSWSALVVFDARTRRMESPEPNLTIYFTGGRHGQRADRAIIKTLRQDGAPSPKITTVVITDDLPLGKRVTNLGAIHRTSGWLDSLLPCSKLQ